MEDYEFCCSTFPSDITYYSNFSVKRRSSQHQLLTKHSNVPFILLAYGDLPFPFVWVPYDDHDWLKDSFFAEDPKKIFEDGTFNVVPTMIGLTKDEGILTSSWFYNNPERFREFWYVCKVD